jgi:hypothetical protein
MATERMPMNKIRAWPSVRPTRRWWRAYWRRSGRSPIYWSGFYGSEWPVTSGHGGRPGLGVDDRERAPHIPQRAMPASRYLAVRPPLRGFSPLAVFTFP